jgi:hypothetical protein
MTTDRRQHDRVAVAIEGTIARLAGPPLAGAGVTVDLSAGGTRFVGPSAFVVGDVVRISLSGDDGAVEHQGLVVGREPKSARLATLNVAFRSSRSNDTVDLRGLVNPLD